MHEINGNQGQRVGVSVGRKTLKRRKRRGALRLTTARRRREMNASLRLRVFFEPKAEAAAASSTAS
jgi:hypothetical protein